MTKPNYSKYKCTRTVYDSDLNVLCKRGVTYLGRTITNMWGHCSVEVFNDTHSISTLPYPLGAFSFQKEYTL